MDRISGLNASQVAKEKVGGAELKRLEKKSEKIFPSDTVYEILLHSDLKTIHQYCMTHKNNHCDTIFWKNKLKGKIYFNHYLPSIIIDENRTVEHFMYNLELNDINQLSKELYIIMEKSYNKAKHILLVNKIEKNSNFNKTNGIIIIDINSDLSYGKGTELTNILPFNITIDYYLPFSIKFTLLENNYKIEYEIFDAGTEDYEIYEKILNENEMINILTLFLFDTYTLYSIGIVDDKNKSFSPINATINPTSSSFGRERIWDTLKYMNI